ncbi:MAG: hypothetical protein ACE5R6_18505 [Candidatus Heimdallarchaeota archaeon]
MIERDSDFEKVLAKLNMFDTRPFSSKDIGRTQKEQLRLKKEDLLPVDVITAGLYLNVVLTDTNAVQRIWKPIKK